MCSQAGKNGLRPFHVGFLGDGYVVRVEFAVTNHTNFANPFEGFAYHFEINETVQVIEVKASGVAEMFLHHVTGPEAGEGQVFFDEHFKALTFDLQGRVVPRQP